MKTRWIVLLAIILTTSSALELYAQKAEQVPVPVPPPTKKSDAPRRPDVVFVPTPQEAVDKMLEVAQLKKGDILYDLGCGDGRIVVTAAKKYGVKATGIDIDPKRVEESLE